MLTASVLCMQKLLQGYRHQYFLYTGSDPAQETVCEGTYTQYSKNNLHSWRLSQKFTGPSRRL
jgi:hypothetical protein